MSETMKTILGRRSIRAYLPEQIKDEELNVILEAAKYAPNGRGTQNWHFSVVQKQETLQVINEACRMGMLHSGEKFLEERAKAENFSIFYHAPTLIVVSGDEKDLTPLQNCSLAMGNMFLAAESVGIGSCWIHAVAMALNAEQSGDLRKSLGIPDGYRVCASGAFGYKAESPQPAPRKEGTVTMIK